MVMQPASANASACTGDGPATPALSSVIDADPLVPERIRLPVQVRSTTVGGLATSGIVACHVQMEPPRSRSTQTKTGISPFFASFPVPSYRAAERPGTGAACGGKIGLFVTIDLIATHASGRTTSRYVSTCPKALFGPHASVLLWRI